VSYPGVSHSRGRDLERLLTFVDAIAAIAITLLVLPLVELTSEVTPGGSVASVLRANQPLLWSFVLSFAVISRFWFAQHRSLRHVLYAHDGLTALLMLWTLTIVFLPFPTALVAQAGDQVTTKVVYIGTLIVSTVVIALMDLVIIQNPQITDGTGLPDLTRAVINAMLLLLALVISVSVPATSYFPLLLLVLDAPVRRLLGKARR
jgi:TMEM175 potassium channel family protein